MLEVITTSNRLDGTPIDLSNLTDMMVNSADESMASYSTFENVSSQFEQFISARAIVAARNYYAKFGTDRWRIIAYDPVGLVGDSDKGGLKVTPFCHYDERNHHWGNYTLSNSSDVDADHQQPYYTPILYGFYITRYSPKRVLDHKIQLQSGRVYKSNNIGVARLQLPENFPATPEPVQLPRNVRKFGKFLAELTDFERNKYRTEYS